MMIKRGLFIGFILFCSGMILTGISAENQTTIPEDLNSAISSALRQADQISFTSDTDTSRDLIQSTQNDLVTIEELLKNYATSGKIGKEDADSLSAYLKIWNGLFTAYDDMIVGGEHKTEGYAAILTNETDRYEAGLNGFESAKEDYSRAYESLNTTKILLSDLDSDEIAQILPDASVPAVTDINKMLFRLRDNIMLCQAYQDLCKAEIAKVSSGDVNATAVQEPLIAATTLMKKLIPSPYVGEEASLFANITLS